MNKKVSIAVGAAAAVAFAGSAFAANLTTINTSEAYVDADLAIHFIPDFITADCTARLGTSTSIQADGNNSNLGTTPSTVGNCNDHGTVAAAQAAGVDIGAVNTSATTTSGNLDGLIQFSGLSANSTTVTEGWGGSYFGNADMMPLLANKAIDGTVPTFNDATAWSNQPPFSSGLLNWDRGNAQGGVVAGSTQGYFNGLSNAWTTYNSGGASAAADGGDAPIGVPQLNSSAESIREHWIDQTVVGYITSNDGTALNSSGANTLYDQNLRSQLSWVGGTDLNTATQNDAGAAAAHIDQRLEQDLMLDGVASAAFEATRQTLQTAFAVDSWSGTTDGLTNPASGNEGGIDVDGTGLASGDFGSTTTEKAASRARQGLGQLVTQDIEGWFYSCMNCDSTRTGANHAFTPNEQTLTFQPYTSGWRDIPSIQHGGTAAVSSSTADVAARNLSTVPLFGQNAVGGGTAN